LTIVLLSTILFALTCKHPFNNPVDPDSEDYIGSESKDNDGDGIGQWEDVDEIVLLRPGNGGIVSTTIPTLLVYKFNPEKVKRYWIQISSSGVDFDSSIVFSKDNYYSNECIIPAGLLNNHGTYYWRARAYDGKEWSNNWSAVLRYDILLGVPQNPSTPSGGLISDKTPLLKWDSVPEASNYYIQINEQSNFSGTVIADVNSLNNPELQITNDLSNATYYWRVRIQNGDVWGDWSDTWNFTVVDAITSGLEAFYPFTGNANDNSGNGNNGTVYGSLLTTNRLMELNKAYYFDGTNDYINCGNSESLNPTKAVTISAWIYLESYPIGNNWVSIINKRNSYVLQIRGSTGLVLTIYESGSIWKGITRNVTPQTDFSLNQWYHVVGSFDEQTLEGYLYINAINKSVGPNYNGWPTTLSPSSDSVYIGSEKDLNWQWFHGKIDDIRIYNRSLTAEEIQILFNLNE